MAEAAAASALVGAAPAAPRQPCRRRPPAPRRVADLRCRAAAGEGVPTPLDVLRNDVSYLEDLHGELVAAHRSAHDEVVAVLNPIAGEQMQRELEEQIAGMQAELAAAHMQIHRSEGRLRDTVANLTELENSVRRSFGPSSWTNGPAVAPAKAMAAPAAAAAATAAPEAAVQQRPRPQPAAPAPPAQRTAEPRSGGRAGLASRGKPGLAIPEQLKDYWFPVEFSASLVADRMVPFELFGETWVLFRDEHGVAACVKDECAHRACPLSLGSVVDGRLQCPYHGWEYDRAGACTKMPSTAFCKGIKVEALPVSEADGLVWVWPGRPEVHAEAGPPPPLARPPPGFEVHAELVLDVPVEHGLLLENLLDLAHAPFTHTTTFAKGWPVPDVVRFNAARLLGGSWEPYPIDMEFGPPCLVLSTIGLTSPGKIERGARADSCKNHLHQLHVCLPSSEGRTRLLYRMSLDFLGWTRNLPGIGAFWKSIAEQVLGEDLVLVKGQQDRMSRGADVWANPVSYDKLGVRYRRWRNSVASGDPAARQQAEASLRQMSAGDIFAPTAGQEEAH